MKKLFFTSLLFLSVIAIFNSCKKNDTGGKATVILSPAHHDDPIYGATVYVKFGATELPSNPTLDYDLKVGAQSTEATVTVDNLRPGDYYFYGVGYDPAILQEVKGGIGLSIKWSERKNEISSSLPITE